MTAAAVDRRIRPVPGPAAALHLPVPRRRRLDMGLELLAVEHRKLPLAGFTLVLPRGSAAEAADRAGAAGLTAGMLDEGTRNFDALTLADELDAIGAHLGAGAGWDSTFVTLSTLTRHCDRALDLFAEVVLRPAFDEAEWTRIRKQRLDGLLSAADQPATLAAWAFDAALYSADHPYGRPAGGTPTSVAALSSDDLRRFYHETYAPRGATLVVFGDLDTDAIARRLERAFDGWSGTVEESVPAERPLRADGVRITIVDVPGASQSVLRVGHVGTARNHPDYFALRIANTILGGYFASRLNRRLREEKGWTYGIRSAFDFRRSAGPFMIAGSVHTKDTAAAVSEIVSELRGLVGERPPTADETSAAINFLTRGFARHFETPRQIGENFAAVVVNRLSDDYFNTWVPRVQAITVAEAGRSAREHIHPDRLDIVLAGDASVVAAALERSGLGTVRVIDKSRVFE